MYTSNAHAWLSLKNKSSRTSNADASRSPLRLVNAGGQHQCVCVCLGKDLYVYVHTLWLIPSSLSPGRREGPSPEEAPQRAE